MTARLFQPLDLGPCALPNRIAVAPMCQYSADDGSATDWHLQHWMNLAMSGAGLVVLEATAVERRGRITHGDLGLYSQANALAMARCLAAARAVALPGTKFGIQIAHAGRKASAQRPWEGGRSLQPSEDAWPTIGPSAIPFAEGWATPAEMTEEDVRHTIDLFVKASVRAAELGFDEVEMHMAHGYLMHSFQSPLSNKRTDARGGTAAKRLSTLVDLAQAVRKAVPKRVAVGARITGSDWVDGGLTVDNGIALAGALKETGFDFVCVSSGANSLAQKIPTGPGYQVHLAEAVKKATGIVTRAVGLIATPAQAEEVLERGAADQVAIGRAFLDNPRWGWHAADALGFDLPRPPQMARVKPNLWPGAGYIRG
ncbi:NADH:flavin oxidoreductase/NADH oxidase [uncultured Alsobacter sp.]|uniref:NADH:flavin oxidoreductase/NADH oxidase n=1 Tax=uncultured Alsobacter sp. TaxID=1748258 RepID=UPI0025ECFAC4|nr:NADH:flavin oxidoreductase/NADH oxidase [uncultured Alsobacter sp.]